MSWVVLAGILIEVFSPQRGVVGYIYTLLGKEAPNLLTNTRLFRPILIITGIWQSVGWGTIVYLAAISSIDPGLYESASIDGANRFQQAARINELYFTAAKHMAEPLNARVTAAAEALKTYRA
jgi:putative aldouronate transport system permease protein